MDKSNMENVYNNSYYLDLLEGILNGNSNLNNISEDILFGADTDLSVIHFSRCLHWKKKKDLNKAKQEIDYTIGQIELKDKCLIDNHIACLNNMIIQKHILRVYTLAGELSAMQDNNEEALKYYQKMQYFVSQLKSDFEDLRSGVLYSFRSVSVHSLSDLISNSLTVCHPAEMNDPFDSLFQFWASKENLHSRCNDKNHIDSLVESFQSYRIRSFVGDENLIEKDDYVKKILMWSHYANSHKGFCIRYRFSEDMIKKPKSDNANYNHYYLKKVIYQKNNQLVSVNESSINSNLAFATKSKDWDYEDEIRLISYDPSFKGSFMQIPLDVNSKIEAIYFGIKCPEVDQRNIMKILESDNNIQYYRMVYNIDNIYSLEIEEIVRN